MSYNIYWILKKISILAGIAIAVSATLCGYPIFCLLAAFLFLELWERKY